MPNTVSYEEMKQYVVDSETWLENLKAYFNNLPEDQPIDIGSNPPPPPPPPPMP